MIEKVKSKGAVWLKQIASNFLEYLPIALLGIVMCFSINAIFGSENSLIVVGIASLFTVKDLYKTTFSAPNYIRSTVYLLLLVTLGTIASLNFIIAIVINFAALFFISFVHSSNLRLGEYFTIALQLLLMQYPGSVEISALLPRLLCCVFCIVLSGIFLLIMNNFFSKHYENPYVLRGCSAIANKLSILTDNPKNDKVDLFALTTEFCNSGYIKMRKQGNILDETAKNDFLALMTMEQLSDLIYDTASKLTQPTDKDKEYFSELYHMFSNIKNIKRLALSLSSFADDYSLSNPQLSSLWKKYLLTLAEYLKYKNKPKIKTSIKQASEFKISILKKRWGLASYNMRNALQLSTIVTICCTAAQILPVSDAMIIPITALAVLSTYPKVKLKHTIPGAVFIIFVAVVYMLVLGWLPFAWRTPAAIIFSMLGLATAKREFGQAAFATQVLSCVLYPTLVISPDVLMKFAFVGIGCILSWVLVRWIFNTPKNRIYKLHISDLIQYDWTAIRLLEEVRLDKATENYLCEFMLIQHLMVEHISNSSPHKIESNKFRYSSMLSFNCDLLTEIAYALTILKLGKLPKDWLLAMKKRVTNIF